MFQNSKKRNSVRVQEQDKGKNMAQKNIDSKINVVYILFKQKVSGLNDADREAS